MRHACAISDRTLLLPELLGPTNTVTGVTVIDSPGSAGARPNFSRRVGIIWGALRMGPYCTVRRNRTATVRQWIALAAVSASFRVHRRPRQANDTKRPTQATALERFAFASRDVR